MPEYSPLQKAILEIIQQEIAKDLIAGKCKLSDAEFIERVVKKKLSAPHKNSIGSAIDKLAAKGLVKKETNSLPGSTGRVREVTLTEKGKAE